MRKQNFNLRGTAVIISAFFLMGCGTFQDQSGITKSTPAANPANPAAQAPTAPTAAAPDTASPTTTSSNSTNPNSITPNSTNPNSTTPNSMNPNATSPGTAPPADTAPAAASNNPSSNSPSIMPSSQPANPSGNASNGNHAPNPDAPPTTTASASVTPSSTPVAEVTPVPTPRSSSASSNAPNAGTEPSSIDDVEDTDDIELAGGEVREFVGHHFKNKTKIVLREHSKLILLDCVFEQGGNFEADDDSIVQINNSDPKKKQNLKDWKLKGRAKLHYLDQNQSDTMSTEPSDDKTDSNDNHNAASKCRMTGGQDD